MDAKLLKSLAKAAQHKHRSLVARIQARMSCLAAWFRVCDKLSNHTTNCVITATASSKKLGFFLKPIVESLKLGADSCAQVSLASDLCLHLALAQGQANFQSAVDKLICRMVYAYLPTREHQVNKVPHSTDNGIGFCDDPWKNHDEYFIPCLKNFASFAIKTEDSKGGGKDSQLYTQPNLLTIAFMNSGLEKPTMYLPATIEDDIDHYCGDPILYTHLIALILKGSHDDPSSLVEAKLTVHQDRLKNRVFVMPAANVTCNGALITLQRLMHCFTPPQITSLLPRLQQITSPSALLNRMTQLEARLGQNLLTDEVQNVLCELAASQFTASRVLVDAREEVLRQEMELLCERLSNTKVNFFRFGLAKVLGALMADHQILDDVLAGNVVRSFIATMIPHAESTDLSPKFGLAEGLIHLLGPLGQRRPNLMLQYTTTFIVPILGLMTDSNAEIRCAGSYCFSQLLPFLNVCDHEIPDCFKDNPYISEISARGSYFLQNFTKANPTTSPSCVPFNLPFPLKNDTKLREYQEEGVRWLLFLRDFKLHGLLCDDMGLGKTLQTLCAIAHHYVSYRRGKGGEGSQEPLVSLIVCPSSLVYHWSEEVQRFFPTTIMKPFIIKGQPLNESTANDGAVILICSYETVRKRADEFKRGSSLQYLVLDEGHIIKNPRTKLTRAVKTIPAKHRLILSGTPIQNNVVELWSLFDFLMPGYLGTEKQFNLQYSKPITLSRDAKHQSKELETAVVALGNLHKQVLPFLMRRTKDQVLSDLPPKIIQDYACTLTWLQADLYRDYVITTKQSHLHNDLDDCILPNDQTPAIHTFKALNYLRKICNHPALVLDQNHPRWSHLVKRYVGWTALKGNEFSEINLPRTGKEGGKDIDRNTLLRDARLSGKLMALVDLLRECNIISPKIEDSDDSTENSSKFSIAKDPEITCNALSHRALIFFQIVDTLEMTATYLKSAFPTVNFLTLKGSIPANERHDIVKSFNENAFRGEGASRYDLLLLTTRVGGLGLNLTGADTVIFFEHDWNPMKDLQAMDRAHRIGQKRTVNVYRLITKDTLEEKIMSLQKFKIGVANAVIDADNSDYSKVSQACDNVLDLFPNSQFDSKPQEQKSKRIKGLTGSKSFYDCQTQVDWVDDGHYEEEFDLTRFMAAIDK